MRKSWKQVKCEQKGELRVASNLSTSKRGNDSQWRRESWESQQRKRETEEEGGRGFEE